MEATNSAREAADGEDTGGCLKAGGGVTVNDSIIPDMASTSGDEF